MSAAQPPIRAIVFDAYGTLFDTHSTQPFLEAAFPGLGGSIAQVWRLKQLEYSWLRAAEGRCEDFEAVTRDALRFALRTFSRSVGPARLDELAAGFNRLELFPDVVEGLRSLEEFRLAVFSNGSPRMLRALVDHPGIGDRFERLISVDPARTFKPSPRAYRLACDEMGLTAEEVLLVSSNGFDLQGAAAFGLRTARIQRTPLIELRKRLLGGINDADAMVLALRGQVETMGPPPAVTLHSLAHLRAAIDGLA